MIDQGLKPSPLPLNTGAQKHLDDIRKVIEGYTAELDTEK